MNEIQIDEASIKYGVPDGLGSSEGFFTHPCPRCGGRLFNWGTSGELLDGYAVYATWKCMGECLKSDEPGHCLFDELLTDDECLSQRYRKQAEAMSARQMAMAA